MTREHSTEQATHRNHPLRRFQSAFEGQTLNIVRTIHRLGLVDNTRVDDVLRARKELHPDDLTLTGLQITVKAARMLVDGASLEPIGYLMLGGAFDAFDGSLARNRGLSSPDGAVNDVIADRAGELNMAHLIAEVRGKYDPLIPDLEEELMVAFQLSTLTKATAEMLEVRTSEGGIGSMIERRRILPVILHHLGRLNMSRESGRRTTHTENVLLPKVDENIQDLIQSSNLRAVQRTRQIMEAQSTRASFVNQATQNPSSPAAIEARKYAAVVLMNRQLGTEGIDMVGHLNSLVEGADYPSLEDLKKLEYIDECITNTENFRAEAISIAGW